MMRLRKLIAIILVSFITGCATTAPRSPVALKAEPAIPGFYHSMKKGETLWRISKAYNVGLEEIVRINRISDVTDIEIGQLIFIPGEKTASPAGIYTAVSRADDFAWPLEGKIITYFGQIYNNAINRGVNIEPRGTTQVTASRTGKVIFRADNFLGMGKTIIIDHHDGFSTVYARNSDVFIKVGDNVRRGQVIAKAGSSGRDKNAYLHFEIRKAHIPKNPLFYLPD